MEDSDHEVQSSSDERDSCPASPDRDEDQVPDNVSAEVEDIFPPLEQESLIAFEGTLRYL